MVGGKGKGIVVSSCPIIDHGVEFGNDNNDFGNHSHTLSCNSRQECTCSFTVQDLVKVDREFDQ